MLWVGTNNKGLNVFNADSETFRRFEYNPNDPASLANNTVWHIFEDKTGMMWIGTYEHGLFKYNQENRSFKKYIHDPDNSTSISDNVVNAIYQDKQGLFWIGASEGGLDMFDPGKEIFTYDHRTRVYAGMFIF